MLFSSTSKCLLVPFFSPIRPVWADGFFRKRCLDVRTVCRLPEPGDTFHSIVFSQPALSYAAKYSHPGPLLKFSMNHRRADSFKLLSRQSVPNDSCHQDVHYRGEKESVRIFWLSATARLAGILFSIFARICGEQRFNDRPECIRDLPGFDACHSRGYANLNRLKILLNFLGELDDMGIYQLISSPPHYSMLQLASISYPAHPLRGFQTTIFFLSRKFMNAWPAAMLMMQK